MNIKNAPTFKLAQITRLKRHWVDRALARVSLSRTQWQTLIWIHVLGYATEQQEILKHSELDPAHLTRVLDQLENMNYISRRRNENNRRCAMVTITERGRKILRIIERILQREETMIFKDFTVEEKNQFIQLLERMEINLQHALKSE